MKRKKRPGRKLLSVLLTLAMAIGLLPGISLTAYAADTLTVDDLAAAVGNATFENDQSDIFKFKVVDGKLVRSSPWSNTEAHSLTYNSTDEKYHLKFGDEDNDCYIVLDSDNYITAFMTENGYEYDSYTGKSQYAMSVTYIDEKGVNKICAGASYEKLNSDEWGTEGTETWYVLMDNERTIKDRIMVSGTVNIILCDGCTLTANKGITVTSGNTLNIYAQSGGDNMGALLTGTVDSEYAGIGGGPQTAGGTVTINGGTIKVAGGEYGAGIGGGGSKDNLSSGAGGTITINGGTVTANGGKYSAGIGGGSSSNMAGGAGGTITINGGTVTANGGSYGAGIGSGTGAAGGTITINGGVVTANGGSTGAGIGAGFGGKGGKAEINGGTVTANGGEHGAGIGGGGGTTDSNNFNLILGTGMYLYGSESTPLVISEENNIRAAEGDYARKRYMAVNNVVPHTHIFNNYSASGDTITATCTAEDCLLENGVATLTIAAPTAGGGAATLTGASDFDVSASDIEYSSNNGNSWSKSVPSGDGFYQARITVSGSYTASVSYGVNAIHKADATNGSITVPAVATVGADVTIETTPDTGYELDSLTVTKESSGTVTASKDGNKGSFTMPAENVTVSASFKKTDYTISIAEDILNGTVAVDKATANYKDKITVSVTPDAGYILNSITVRDAEEQPVAAKGTMFSMPASNVTVSATFDKLGTYTLFYRAEGSPDSVKFRMTDSGEGHNMTNSAKLGDIDCWAIPISAAEGRDSFPVAFSTDGGSTWGSLTDRNVLNDIPADLAEGSAAIVSGEAKAFIVSFLWGDVEADEGSDSYQAEEGKSKNFLVTNNTTSVALQEPSREGFNFLGFDDGKSESLKQVSGGAVDISGTNGTSIFAARWKQINCDVTYKLNGGSGNAPKATLAYGSKASAPANPTRDGYSFVRWVVAKSVTERINGRETRLSAGTPFNFSTTEIINDIELRAEWKHVHSYVRLQLNDPVFEGAFDNIINYAQLVHIRICTSMDDYTTEAHSFDGSGKCACGATRPVPTASLEKTIDNAVESTTQVIKNSVVSISAPKTKNSKQFSKWQYYNGSKWADLSKNAYTAFVIPADLRVRAVYEGKTAELSVESFNYKGNIAFSFSYSVPDGYTVVDGGILYGNNAHIRYMDAKQLVANVSGLGDLMFPYIPEVEMPVHYEPAKDNAVAKYQADKIANRMFAEQAINISGSSTPLFKKLPAFGKSGQTAIAINTSAGNIYYYGMGYVICKDPSGKYVPFTTNAIAVTRDNPDNSTTKTINLQ